MARPVVAVVLRRVPIDQRPREHRMRLAADFVLDGVQNLPAVQIDDVLETIFVLPELDGEQTEIDEPAVRAREIADIDLRVMAVIGKRRSTAFHKVEELLFADLNLRLAFAPAGLDGCGRAHHLPVEPCDYVRRAGGHVERNVCKPERHATKATRLWRVHSETVSPRTHHIDAVVGLAELKLRILQMLADTLEPLEQGFLIGDDEAHRAAQDVGELAGRKMKLAHPNIHPHDANASVEIGITRQPQSRDVEMRCNPLIGNVEVDVAEVDDVSQVLSRSIESLFFHP